MPFQSEKQRRYLWANEPKIARDWADTYGSRIEKNDGGIMRTGFFKGAQADTSSGSHMSPGTSASGKGRSDKSGPPGGGSGGPGGDMYYKADPKKFDPTTPGAKAHAEKVKAAKIKKDFEAKDKKKKEPFLPLSLQLLKNMGEKYNPWARKKWMENYMKKNPIGNPQPGKDRFSPEFDWENWSEDDWNKPENLKLLEEIGYNTHRPAGSGGGDGRGTGYMGYPSYEAWKAAQGAQGAGITAATTVEPLSAFQKSLTGTVDTPGYYVGSDPTASNLAWGKQFGADPRTMGQTSWAANGGRIPAAFGGIMDSSTGRRAYGFGSIFKSIKKAAGKVLKSPIGKAALLGAGFYYGGGSLPFFGQRAGATGFGSKGFGMKQLAGMLKGGGKYADDAWNPWKIGIGALSAAPLFMGGQDEDEDEGFDYMGAKNAYADEIKRIKAGAMAGSLDPNEFSYLGVKDGGRIGLYAGGQSTPSDYTMEDAMMTTTQDKLGGITDVMKQADLNRQGSVGQFYAAHGGSADAKLMARIKELQDEGLDYNSAMAQALKELSKGKAQGGRIGAEEGGLMDLGGMEKDYRNDGGFVPLGGEEKADDVPARLSKNEFVFTADAVRGAGDGDIDKGAEIMENIMKNLEQGGQISDETQGLSGAQEMFGVSERLSEVV